MTADIETARDGYSIDPVVVVAELGSDAANGLTTAEAAARLARYGPNEITGEPPPSRIEVMGHPLADPMNLMLIGVSAISLFFGEFSTAVFVAILVGLNVLLGARQELKAREAVDALAVGQKN